MAETAALDDDELAAFDGIVAFLRDCQNDPEVIEALTLAECAPAARAFAADEAG